MAVAASAVAATDDAVEVLAQVPGDAAKEADPLRTSR
jgi:hypothetical protein